jgi:sugar fermentation stimulation protein A
VSTRATKHLRELMHVVDTGSRAVLLFCVQRGDVGEVRPADAVDAAYGGTLREALCRGVEVLAYRAAVSVQGIVLQSLLPVVCP